MPNIPGEIIADLYAHTDLPNTIWARVEGEYIRVKMLEDFVPQELKNEQIKEKLPCLIAKVKRVMLEGCRPHTVQPPFLGEFICCLTNNKEVPLWPLRP